MVVKLYIVLACYTIEMAVVKKLLGSAVVATILGIIFAGLLVNAHLCLVKAKNEDNPKQLSTCYVARLVYLILLGTSIIIGLLLSITGWILVQRQTSRGNLQPDEVHYDVLSSPEEDAISIRVPSRRDSVESSEPPPNPYSAYPPAVMYAH